MLPGIYALFFGVGRTALETCMETEIIHPSPVCKTADERLFDSILGNTDHVLHHLLPPQSEASLNYNLRPRTHNLKLSERNSRLTDCNYIQRM